MKLVNTATFVAVLFIFSPIQVQAYTSTAVLVNKTGSLGLMKSVTFDVTAVKGSNIQCTSPAPCAQTISDGSSQSFSLNSSGNNWSEWLYAGYNIRSGNTYYGYFGLQCSGAGYCANKDNKPYDPTKYRICVVVNNDGAGAGGTVTTNVYLASPSDDCS